ncbi:MAG: hypothetical protein RR840_09695 [Clostridium sp.]
MEGFIATPNCPSSSVSLAVVDGRIPKDIEENLYKREIKLIKTEKINKLYKAVSYHPDIMMCHIGGNRVVVAKNIPNSIVYSLEENGIEIIYGSSEVLEKYPNNIQYNVCVSGDVVICNQNFIDKNLLKIFQENGKSIIHVKQGYTKCSTAVANSSSFVTSDNGIHTILIREKLKSLLISPGSIDLFELDYGFIGGASGKISSCELGFYGNINLHSDAMFINLFLNSQGITPVSLSENKLIDLGTLIPLKEYNGI